MAYRQRLLHLPHRHGLMPTIYVAENHPLVTGRQPYQHLGARTYVGYMQTDPESMAIYRDYEKGLKCPLGDSTAWDGSGLLQLRPGDYLFLRDVNVSEDPSDDVLAVLVTGQLHHTPAQIAAYELATQTMLGPAGQRTPDLTAFEATGCAKKIRGKRCYQGGTAIQQSRRVVAPAASLQQARANMGVYQGMVNGIVDATADMLLNVQDAFPESYLDAFEANSDLTGQPAIGNAHVLGTSSVQFNISAAGLSATDNRLGNQLGDFGCEHFDRNDSPDHFTTMFSNPDIPLGYNHGAFHLLQLGVYVVLAKIVGVSFSGRRLHVGTAPTPPQGVVGVPWAYRNNTVWYAKLAAVDGRSRFTLASLPTKNATADSDQPIAGKSGSRVKGKGKQVEAQGKAEMQGKEGQSETGKKKGKGKRGAKGKGKEKEKVLPKPEPLYITPEMININDDGFVPPTSNRATFARSGHVIMNRESQMNFMGKSLHLLNSYVYRQLPPSFGIRIDVHAMLSAVTYLDEAGNRVALLDWPSAPNVGEVSATRKSNHTLWTSFQAKVRRFIPQIAARGSELVEVEDDSDDENSDVEEELGNFDRHAETGSSPNLGGGASSVEEELDRSLSGQQDADVHGLGHLSHPHSAIPLPSTDRPTRMMFSHIEIPRMPSNLKKLYKPNETLRASFATTSSHSSSSTASPSKALGYDNQSLDEEHRSSTQFIVTSAEPSQGIMHRQTSIVSTEFSPTSNILTVHSSLRGVRPGLPPGERELSPPSATAILVHGSRVSSGLRTTSTSPELPVAASSKRRVPESPLTEGSSKRPRSSSVKVEEHPLPDSQPSQAKVYPFVEKLTIDVLWKESMHLSRDLEHTKERMDGLPSFDLPQLLAAYQGATKSPLTLDYMRTLISQVRSHGADDSLQALRIRMERYSVLLSSIHMWYWLDVIIRQHIRDIFEQPSGPSNITWLSAAVDISVFALRWQQETVRFDPARNSGIKVLLSVPVDIPNRQRKKRFLQGVQSDQLLLLEAVTQTVQNMLMIALDFPKDDSMRERKRAWVMGTIADSIGPEFLATRYVWDAYVGFSIKDYISDPQAYRSVNSDLVQPFKSALLAHPITSFDSNEYWLYQSFVKDWEHSQRAAPLMATPPITFPQSPSGASPFPGLDLFVGMSLQYLDGQLSSHNALAQYLLREPDFRLPFRERAPLRLRFCSDSGPYAPSIIRTNAGIYSAIVFRGITYNTPFSNHRESPMVFLDADDWRARIAAFRQAHPESQGNPHYFCKPHAYGQSITTRGVENAEGFWEAVLSLDWPALVARQMTFSQCLSMITKVNLRSMGSLCNYLLACDLHYAGICNAPTAGDIAGAMMSIRGGSYTALSVLGLIPSGTKPTRRQIESILVSLESHFRTFFTDQARDAMVWDLICLEHLLCKFARAVQHKVASSM